MIWEPQQGPLRDRPRLVTALRLRWKDGAAPPPAATACLFLVNDVDLLASTTVGRMLSEDGAAIYPISPPLMLVEEMEISVVLGSTTPVALERQVERLEGAEGQARGVAWFAKNQITGTYPVDWYGGVDAERMKAKLAATVAEARARGLEPRFLASTGQSCAACQSADPARGPYNVHLLTREEGSVLWLAAPVICGACAEVPAAVDRLIDGLGRPPGHARHDEPIDAVFDDPLPTDEQIAAAYRRGQRMVKPRGARRRARKARDGAVRP